MSRAHQLRRGDADKRDAILLSALTGIPGFPEWPPGYVQVEHNQRRVARMMEQGGLLEHAPHGHTPGVGRWFAVRRYRLTPLGKHEADLVAAARPVAAYGLPRRLLQILGEAWGYGGAIWLTGSWRAYGERGAREKLLELVDRSREGGRASDVYRLTDRAQDLAARCHAGIGAVARLNELRAQRGFPPLRFRARHVPDRLPASAARSGPACPRCGCTPAKPCAIRLGDAGELGEARCWPAGTHNLPRCSACLEAA